MNSMRQTDGRTKRLAAGLLSGMASATAMVFASDAWSQPAGGPQNGPPRGPPPEALAACKSLASDAVCGFNGPQGAVSGTCFAPQQGMALACRPKDAPAPGAAASGSRR